MQVLVDSKLYEHARMCSHTAWQPSGVGGWVSVGKRVCHHCPFPCCLRVPLSAYSTMPASVPLPPLFTPPALPLPTLPACALFCSHSALPVCAPSCWVCAAGPCSTPLIPWFKSAMLNQSMAKEWSGMLGSPGRVAPDADFSMLLEKANAGTCTYTHPHAPWGLSARAWACALAGVAAAYAFCGC